MYDTQEEIHQKLAGCILIYGGKPIFVLDGCSPGSFRAYFLEDKNQRHHEISIHDDELNYRNLGPYLGYMNVDTYKGYSYKESTYLMRQPIRRSVQGLAKGNVFVAGFKGNLEAEIPSTGGSVNFDLNLHSGDNVPAFSRMISGEYPTVSEIEKEFLKDRSVTSRAFDRRWSLQRDLTGPFGIFYKNQKVGYTEDFKRFVISDRYRFLRSDLRHIS